MGCIRTGLRLELHQVEVCTEMQTELLEYEFHFGDLNFTLSYVLAGGCIGWLWGLWAGGGACWAGWLGWVGWLGWLGGWPWLAGWAVWTGLAG